jgi:hypothetical protein
VTVPPALNAPVRLAESVTVDPIGTDVDDSVVVRVGVACVTVTVVLPVLPECTESPLYVAVTVAVPIALGVNVTEQVAVVPEPESVQVAAVKVPETPVLAKATVPVGVLAMPVDESMTVPVQVVA